LPHHPMNSDDDTLAGGLPHSEIPGSPIARISPRLFAACHVLHRLSVPRHPPDALTSRLTTGISQHNHSSATTVAPPDAAPPPRTGPKLHPRAGGDPYTAASHEDTSSDRPGASSACATLGRQRRWRYADRRSLASPKGPDTSIACVRAYPPRSHHNSLSSPFNQHPAAGVHPAAASRALLRTSSLAAVPRAPVAGAVPTGEAWLRPWLEVPMVEVPMVEVNGFEPMTSCLQSRRSPS
jgi:hypothetical protein